MVFDRQNCAGAAVAAAMAIALLFGTAATVPPVAEMPPLPPADTALLLAQQDAAARAAELELLRQYEQADFDVMRGVVYEPVGLDK